ILTSATLQMRTDSERSKCHHLTHTKFNGSLNMEAIFLVHVLTLTKFYNLNKS
ncbi:hypothetical protein L9F63_015396, partial [Diploptera punctata]